MSPPGFKKFLRNRGYEAEVSLLLDDPNTRNSPTPNDGNKCGENCETCAKSAQNPEPEPDRSDESNVNKWKIVKGKFFMINGANISCACKRSPLGFSPYCHIGDGYLDVILVKHSSFINNLKFLLTMTNAKRKISDLNFVDVYRTKKFYFKSLGGDSSESLQEFDGSTLPIRMDRSSATSSWNCDGEVLQETDIVVRLVELIIFYCFGTVKIYLIFLELSKFT
jgi:ceramide kinase